MLHAILQSTNTIVMAVSRVEGGGGMGGSAVMEGENREQAIRAMVDSAFRNCDITGTGKLLPLVSTNTGYSIWLRLRVRVVYKCDCVHENQPYCMLVKSVYMYMYMYVTTRATL